MTVRATDTIRRELQSIEEQAEELRRLMLNKRTSRERQEAQEPYQDMLAAAFTLRRELREAGS